jgi:hypothetical protein
MTIKENSCVSKNSKCSWIRKSLINIWLVNAPLFPPFSWGTSSFTSSLLVLFQNSTLAVSNLIKIYELCDAVTFFYASHPWHNWQHLLVRNRISQKSISSTDLMENLTHRIIFYTSRLLGMAVIWLLQTSLYNETNYRHKWVSTFKRAKYQRWN